MSSRYMLTETLLLLSRRAECSGCLPDLCRIHWPLKLLPLPIFIKLVDWVQLIIILASLFHYQKHLFYNLHFPFSILKHLFWTCRFLQYLMVLFHPNSINLKPYHLKNLYFCLWFQYFTIGYWNFINLSSHQCKPIWNLINRLLNLKNHYFFDIDFHFLPWIDFILKN